MQNDKYKLRDFCWKCPLSDTDGLCEKHGYLNIMFAQKRLLELCDKLKERAAR